MIQEHPSFEKNFNKQVSIKNGGVEIKKHFNFVSDKYVSNMVRFDSKNPHYSATQIRLKLGDIEELNFADHDQLEETGELFNPSTIEHTEVILGVDKKNLSTKNRGLIEYLQAIAIKKETTIQIIEGTKEVSDHLLSMVA